MGNDAALRIAVLGQTRLQFGGEHFPFVTPRQSLQLFAYLILRRAQPIGRDFLAFALWPDEDEDQARENLRRNLYLLQKALPRATGVPWISVEPNALRLNSEAGIRLDADEFERLAADPATREQAADVYGGDFFEALYEEWLEPERERLRTLYVNNLTALVRDARGRRDFSLAAMYAQRALSVEPLREDLARQLIAVRYDAGDRAGALSEYHRFAARLSSELNVEPMPETIALSERIARHSAIGGDFEDEQGTVERAPASLPLVGRHVEVERLGSLWSRAARGRGRTVFIAGPAGIGKTRLLDELALIAETQGGRILRGMCSEPESVAYQGIVEALGANLPLVAALKIAPIWLATVAQVLPELSARRPDLPTLPPLEGDRERMRLLEGVARCIEALAKERPLLLVVDDGHAAGDATAAALGYVARRAGASRLLVVCAYRDDHLTRAHPLRKLRRELLDSDAAETVAPRPLDVQAAHELVAAMQGADSFLDAAALHERSEGNPLFLKELAREAKARIGERRPGGDLPLNVRELVAARVSRLSDSARAFAETAAVAGLHFEVEVVRDAAGWPEHEVDEALAELLERGILREHIGRARNRHAFSHQLIQAAIYANAPPTIVARRHRRYAELLSQMETVLQVYDADVARHFVLGGLGERSAPYFFRAARQAAITHANDEADQFACKALEHAMGAERIEALFLREQLAKLRGDRATRLATIEELDQILTTGDDRGYELLVRKAEYAYSTGDEEAERLAVERIAEAAEHEPRRRPRAAFERGQRLRRQLHWDAAIDSYREAFDASIASGDESLALTSARFYVQLTGYMGRFEAASEMLDRAGSLRYAPELALAKVELAQNRADYAGMRLEAQAAIEVAQGIGDRVLEALAFDRLGVALTFLGDFDGAYHALSQSLEFGRAISSPAREGTALLGLAELMTVWGAVDTSLTLLDRAQLLFESIGWGQNKLIARLNRATTLYFASRYHESILLATDTLKDATSAKQPIVAAEALGTRASAKLSVGEAAMAIADLEESIAIRQNISQVVPIEDLGQLALARAFAGQSSAARAVLAELIPKLLSGDPLYGSDPTRGLASAIASLEVLGDISEIMPLVERGRKILAERIATVSDERVRSAYLALPHLQRFLGPGTIDSA